MKIKLLWGLNFQDCIFLFILICNLLFVAYLGTDIYHEAVKLDTAKVNGETFIVWADEFKRNIDTNNKPEPQACLPKEHSKKEHSWKECVQSLFGDKGKFHDLKNAIVETNPVVSKQCAKKDETTKGAFIFEKVSSSPSGATVYTPFEGSEILSKGLIYRISVCDHGYYRILIGEISL